MTRTVEQLPTPTVHAATARVAPGDSAAAAPSPHEPSADEPSADEPLVSIVICTYNAGADYLRASVRSALAQTHRNLEVLVMDDGSTDGSVDALADLAAADGRLRIVRQPNAGKSVALNRALETLRGEFYAIQDADDESHPRRIERQVAAMREDPTLAGVFTGYELILGPDERRVAPKIEPRSKEECRGIVERYRMPGHDPTALYRVSMVRDLRYDPELRLGQGFDYILQVGERHPLRVLGECLYSYRVHTSGTKRNPERRSAAVVKLREKAQRRRGVPVTDWAAVHAKRGWGRRDHEENNLSGHFVQSVRSQRQAGHYAGALRTALQAVAHAPLSPVYYKGLAYCLVPRVLMKRLNRRAP